MIKWKKKRCSGGEGRAQTSAFSRPRLSSPLLVKMTFMSTSDLLSSANKRQDTLFVGLGGSKISSGLRWGSEWWWVSVG